MVEAAHVRDLSVVVIHSHSVFVVESLLGLGVHWVKLTDPSLQLAVGKGLKVYLLAVFFLLNVHELPSESASALVVVLDVGEGDRRLVGNE